MSAIDDLRAFLGNLSARDVDQLHRNADTDQSKRALHHTLGPKGSQAAPGNHTHDGNDSALLSEETITAALGDTSWVSSGLNITVDTANWTMGFYSLRRVGPHVHGVVRLRYIGATITAGSDGNITDLNAAFVLPSDWALGNPRDEHLWAMRNGTASWCVRALAGGDAGQYDFVAGTYPGQVLATNSDLDFTIDHFTE